MAPPNAKRAGAVSGRIRVPALPARVAHGSHVGTVRRGAGPQLPRMEVGDQRGEAADVVFVRVRQRDHVDASGRRGPTGRARPRPRRYRAAARDWPAERRNAAAIHQHAFAIREDDQDAVALADVDGRNSSSPAWTSARNGMPQQQRQQRRDRDAAADAPARPRANAAAISAAASATPSQTGGVGIAPVRLDAGVPAHHAVREPSSRPASPRDPVPAGEDRHESDRHHHAHQRHDERVRREAGEAEPVEVDHHRQRQAELHDRRDGTIS